MKLDGVVGKNDAAKKETITEALAFQQEDP